MSFRESHIKNQNLRGKLLEIRDFFFFLPKVFKTHIDQIQSVLFKKMCSFESDLFGSKVWCLPVLIALSACC